MANLKRVVPWKAEDGVSVSVCLDRSGDTVVIVAVNANGNTVNRGHLLIIGPDGLTRSTCVGPDLGFPLAPEGRIMLNEV